MLFIYLYIGKEGGREIEREIERVIKINRIGEVRQKVFRYVFSVIFFIETERKRRELPYLLIKQKLQNFADT